MPTKKKSSKKKRPAKMNPLAQYLVSESVREGGTPDRSTKAQVALLMGTKSNGKGSAKAASKKNPTK